MYGIFRSTIKQILEAQSKRSHAPLIMRVNVLKSMPMTPENTERVTAANSSRAAATTTTCVKRRQPVSAAAEHSYPTVQKRVRVASQYQTLRTEEPCRNNTFNSNRFWPIRSSPPNRQQGQSREPEALRKWLISSGDVSTSEDTIVVVSYNLLGVQNASNHQDLYSNIPANFLKWDQRKKVIREEINQYNASVLCFQEVDRFDDVNDAFQKDGFKGVYEARTGEACDGCAMFWKEDLFSLLHQEGIKFKDFDLRDNVAQFCILKMNNNPSESNLSVQTSTTSPTRSRSFLVGNMHGLFNPKRGDIKLGQVRLFLEKAYKLSQEWDGIPVILAGDFNCIPESAMYQFFVSSELEFQLHERRNIAGLAQQKPTYRGFRFRNNTVDGWTEEEIKLAAGIEGATHIKHPLSLSSAYPGIPGGRTRDKNGEPLATSYHSQFMGTVDYIWHTKDLVPVRILDTLPMDALRRTGGLPTQKWGSDHLALVCELAFVEDDSAQT